MRRVASSAAWAARSLAGGGGPRLLLGPLGRLAPGLLLLARGLQAGLHLLDPGLRFRLGGRRPLVGLGRRGGLEPALGVLQCALGPGEIGLGRPHRPRRAGCLRRGAGRRPGRLPLSAARRLHLGGPGGGDRLQGLQVAGRARHDLALRGRRRDPGALRRRQRQLPRHRLRPEQGRVRDVAGGDVVAHDQHPQAELRRAEQPLGEGHGQPYAAVRGRMAGEIAGVQRDAGPGDALHERHLAVLVEVGAVILLLLHDGEDAGRRLVADRAGGDRRLHDLALGVVDRDALVAERDDGHQRLGRAAPVGVVACLAAALCARRLDADAQHQQADRKPLERRARRPHAPFSRERVAGHVPLNLRRRHRRSDLSATPD